MENKGPIERAKDPNTADTSLMLRTYAFERIGKMGKEMIDPLLDLQTCGSYGAFPRIKMSSMPLRRHEAIKIPQTARR